MSSGAIDSGALIEILIAAGGFTAIAETARWFLGGRGRARVDNAKIVQDMAVSLVTPLNDELAKTRLDLASLRTELEQVLSYAIIAHELLRDNPRAPTPPEVVLKRVA